MIESAILQKLPRFHGIGQEATRWLCARASMHHIAVGETIFFEGDPCQDFWMVVEGEVKIAKVLESGRELILGMFRVGESFGEVALVDGEDYPATATAHGDCQIMKLSRSDYLELLGRFPEVSPAIIRDLASRLHALRRRVEILGELGVPARIAQLLYTSAREFGQDENLEVFVPLKLTRMELANMVGARIETVIRIMSQWQKEKVLSTESTGFRIHQPEVLRNLVTGKD